MEFQPTAQPLVARVGLVAESPVGFGAWPGGWDCAGDAASPPPGPGPAAGGCAFGRLRSSASQAKRPHPCKLGRRLLVCAVLRTRQDRGWASCPTRPRHASGPCGSRPCAAPPARPLTHSGGSARHGKKKEEQEQRQKLHSGCCRLPPPPPPTPLRSDRCVDQGRHLPGATRTHRHRESVEGREVSDGGVSAAWMPRPSPQGWVYGAPAIRHLPASPRRNPEPLLALALALASAGAGRSPAEHPPLRSPGMARRYP